MKCKKCAEYCEKLDVPFEYWDEATTIFNAGDEKPLGWALCESHAQLGMVAWGRPYTIEEFKEKYPDAFILQGEQNDQ